MKHAILFSLALSAMAFATQTTDQFGGIGVTIQADQGGVRIVEVLPNSPAEKAGLHPGDLLTAVNGTALTSDVEAAKAILRGETGTEVQVTAQRTGEAQASSYTMVRSELLIKSISTEDLATWYGSSSAYTLTEVRYLAEQQAEQGFVFSDVMDNGRLIKTESISSAPSIQSVYLGEAVQAPSLSLLPKGLNLIGANSQGVQFHTISAGETEVFLRDASGKTLIQINAGMLNAGDHTQSWNAQAISRGTYMVEVRQGNTSAVKTLQIQ